LLCSKYDDAIFYLIFQKGDHMKYTLIAASLLVAGMADAGAPMPRMCPTKKSPGAMKKADMKTCTCDGVMKKGCGFCGGKPRPKPQPPAPTQQAETTKNTAPSKKTCTCSTTMTKGCPLCAKPSNKPAQPQPATTTNQKRNMTTGDMMCNCKCSPCTCTQKKNCGESTCNKGMMQTKSGLKCMTMCESSMENAPMPKKGSMVSVHYTGWLADEQGNPMMDKQFDSSVKRGKPFMFNVGMGQVIKGWDEGVMMMKKGEKRRLVIPSHLAYGPQGIEGIIPGGATLVFDVELLEVMS
jgi:FKBP-type peptidyl-prolyl cis-trans isomerase